MDGDHIVASVIVVCLTSLELGALLCNRDGFLFGAIVTTINGVILWLKSRKSKGRR
jgi:hypothetical protein